MKAKEKKSEQKELLNRKQRGIKKKAVTFPLPETRANLPESYYNFIKEIKNCIQTLP